MAITLERDSNDLSPIDNEFIDRVLNILTLYGSLPYKIPRQMVIEVIKSSAKYFFKYYGQAWRQAYLFLTERAIQEHLGGDFRKFKNNEFQLSVKLPQRVRIIRDIYVAGDNQFANLFEESLNQEYDTTLTGINSYGGFGMGNSAIDRHLYLEQNVCKMVELNALKAIFQKPFAFSYNVTSNMLLFKENVKSNLILHCYIDNEINRLYNDTLFERHVIGCCKRELRRLIGSHTIPLPGDVQLNVDEICNNIEDIEKVEEIVKNASGIGDVIFKN